MFDNVNAANTFLLLLLLILWFAFTGPVKVHSTFADKSPRSTQWDILSDDLLQCATMPTKIISQLQEPW